MANANLNHAKMAKNDEFYTQKEDIENELQHYTKHFAGKVVYLNCDDPTTSEFWRYFYRSFGYLKLKKLIATHYKMDGQPSYALIYQGDSDDAENFDEKVKKVPLKGNGDFRSDECIAYLKQSDIVVTNPMFSLFREYVATLEKYHKKFIIWGKQNAITYKEFFPLLMHRKVWLGNIANKTCVFRIPYDYKKWDKKETEKRHDGHHYAKVPAITVFTNLPLSKYTDQMVIWKEFNDIDYPAYDNYPAFECSRVIDIPKDNEVTALLEIDNLPNWQKAYGDDLRVINRDDDIITVKIKRPIYGVPITFLTKYNPESDVENHNLAKEFDILGMSKGLGFNDINEVKAFKKYQNAVQWSQDGKQSNGSKVNTGANVAYLARPSTGKYYTADNAHGYLHQVYGRILIRAKKNVKL